MKKTVSSPNAEPYRRPIPDPRLIPALALVLAAGTLALYWPVRSFEFFRFDDPQYVLHNPHVNAGLTWDGFLWAFRSFHLGNWHPLTWLSHQLDCALFGMNPGRFHLGNALIHALNAALLFLALRQLTGAVWRSAFAAAFFAVHPLRVESVAWISERKDVLSGLFFMLTLWAYAAYAQTATASTQTAGFRGKKPLFYGAALFCFMAGLLSKSMLVTLPFVLLLLDFWPLGRWQTAGNSVPPPSSIRRIASLVIEKIPFLAVSAAVCLVTLGTQNKEGAVAASEQLPLPWRLGNAVVACGRYLQKMFWPDQLAFLYPHPGRWPASMILVTAALLLAVSAAVFWFGRKRRYLAAGWLWYLGMLVPVIGLVQVGQQSWADRYSYLPLIGPVVMLVWGAHEWSEKRRLPKGVLVFIGAGLIAACLPVTARQLQLWKSTEPLYIRALDVSLADPVYRRAFETIPLYANMHVRFAEDWAKAGEPEQAVRHLRRLAGVSPGNVHIRAALGNTLAMLGRWDEAASEFREGMRLAPQDFRFPRDLAKVRAARRRFDEAAELFEEAIRLNPGSAETRFSLGLVLEQTGQRGRALNQYRKAASMAPDFRPARERLEALGAAPEQ